MEGTYGEECRLNIREGVMISLLVSELVKRMRYNPMISFKE
jgi:hypothetical protein